MRRDFAQRAIIITSLMVEIVERDLMAGEDRDDFLNRVIGYVKSSRELLRYLEDNAKAEQEDRLKGMV